MGDPRWSDYLAGFHDRRAGITEHVLCRARGTPGNPYQWLADVVPDSGRGARPAAST